MLQFILNGVNPPVVFELNSGVNRLGRNAGNDFVISDASVSSFHCEITVGDGVATLKDLNSTNGTFVDGQPVKTTVALSGGQHLAFGSAAFSVLLREVTVAIPELSKPEVPVQTQLQDGSQACLNHPGVPADYSCPKCTHYFCSTCVRALKRTGGAQLILCPKCSAACDRVAPAGKSKGKRSFLGVLAETLKLPFKQ